MGPTVLPRGHSRTPCEDPLVVPPPPSLALSALVRHCHSELVQRASWSALPRWTRGALAAQIIVFSYGVTVHLATLLAGQAEALDDELPGWLGAYFTEPPRVPCRV